MHIVMVAAENDALPGGKVGGLGDVVRDLPIALAEQGHSVTVVTPAYGSFNKISGATRQTLLAVPFGHNTETLELFEVPSPKYAHPLVKHLVLEHPLFSACGVGVIYCNDDRGPFATDANKFALFSSAVCEMVVQDILQDVDIIHCHDWHSAPVLILRAYSPQYVKLQTIGTVFTIHNLSMQGVRPLYANWSSLQSWYPYLQYDVGKICDPENTDCVNFMRASINLSDKVNAVSPNYANEILKPSNWADGNVGGEGLEQDLIAARQENRLFGILNGCDYSGDMPKLEKSQVVRVIVSCLDRWAVQAQGKTGSHYFALRRLGQWSKKRKSDVPMMVSIGRMTTQKLGLLVEPFKQHTVLEEILSHLEVGIYVMMGSGDVEYDWYFTQVAAKYKNFLYLHGYSDDLAKAIYGYGDVFLMPSIYEPCGISQMVAMRGGMPCVAHATGGLKDTVIDGKNGFTFGGETMAEKAENFIRTTAEAVRVFREDPVLWQTFKQGALDSNFSWSSAALKYEDLLYQPLVNTQPA